MPNSHLKNNKMSFMSSREVMLNIIWFGCNAITILTRRFIFGKMWNLWNTKNFDLNCHFFQKLIKRLDSRIFFDSYLPDKSIRKWQFTRHIRKKMNDSSIQKLGCYYGLHLKMCFVNCSSLVVYIQRKC